MKRLTPEILPQNSQYGNADRCWNQRGIALITVLFLTILMTILGLTMVVSVNSDMFINGYYGSARASYYAADSGLNVGRQYLVNQLKASVSTYACLGWGANAADPNCTNPPLSASPSTVLSNLKSAYGSFSAGHLNSGAAGSSWPSSFIITDTANCTNSFAAAAGSPTITNNTVNGSSLVTKYVFSYNYTLCSIGTGTALQRAAAKESGTLMISVSSQDIPPPTFAGYGAFIDNYAPCYAPLVPGTFSGPTFTNGAWQVSNGGPFIFTDPVGQHQANIDYWIGGNCNPSTASSYPGVNVTFQQGLKLGQAAIPLPTSSYNQLWAAVDGYGCGETGNATCGSTATPAAPSNAQLNANLRDINGNPYPTGGASSGVFLPYSGSTFGTATATGSGLTAGYGGGVYVQGNASILLTPGTDSNNNPTQIYTITQGTTVTTITTNQAANTTTFKVGNTTKTLTGIPSNLISNPGSLTASTMIYVNGTITGLSGPGQGKPAIQSNTMMTIAGSGDINITGDVLYTVEPVSVNTADTIVNPSYTASALNTLGVYTSSGNIILASPYSNQNLEVDGSLAAVGATTANGGHCTSSNCGFLVNGSINTFTNVGGQIQSNIFGANMSTQNTYFDRRFTAWTAPGGGSFSPPWFPSIVNGGSYTPQAPVIQASQQRTSWAWIATQ
jgi:Tfp pilus assembly protein PilX